MDNQFELPKEGVRIYNPDSGWQSGPEPSVMQEPEEGSSGSVHSSGRVAPSQDPRDAHDPEYDPEEDDEDEDASHQEASLLDEAAPNAEDSVRTQEEANDKVWAEPVDTPIPMPAQVTPQASPSGFKSRRSNGQERIYTVRQETPKPYPRPPAAAPTEPSEASATSGAAALVPQTQAAALARVGDSLDSLFSAIQRSTLGQAVEGSAPSWRDVANISRHLEDRLNTRQNLLRELHSVDREIRETREDLLLTLNALSEYEQQNLQAASMRASISAVAAKVIAKRFAESSGDT